MAALLFYKAPTALNRDLHKELKYQSSGDYSFTDSVNSVPLTGIEFFEASRDMPVLFSKDEEGRFPLALLSLMEAGHKQLDTDGRWEDSYVPAFVRRYPLLSPMREPCVLTGNPHKLAVKKVRRSLMMKAKTPKP